MTHIPWFTIPPCAEEALAHMFNYVKLCPEKTRPEATFWDHPPPEERVGVHAHRQEHMAKGRVDVWLWRLSSCCLIFILRRCSV